MNNDIELLNKSIDIISQKEDKELVTEISNYLGDFLQTLSDVQIDKLILNDIDYPTDYAKTKQAKLELIIRYYNIVDLYYDIKKKELGIELSNEKINTERHPIKKKIKELDRDKSIIQLMNTKNKLQIIIKEMNIYYKYYKKYDKGYDKLNDEEKNKLEIETWNKKAINNPVVFEERYGNYLKDILGEKSYSNYVEKRIKRVGLFQRELI